MSVKGTIQKARNKISENPKGAVIYALGRFYWIRQLRRGWNRMTSPSAPLQQLHETVVMSSGSDPNSIVKELKETGVSRNIALSNETLKNLLDACRQAQTHDSKTHKIITIEKAKQHNSVASNKKILMINHKSQYVSELTEIIANSPILRAIAKAYMGTITGVEIRLQTSLATEADITYREEQNQTVMFHYDVHALNFLYVFSYLSDCTKESGAHEVIINSHTRKPMRHLFSSARKSDQEIYSTYPGKSMIIEGPRGSGFIEDTSFHRAHPPLTNDRIALQIRYSG